MLRLLQLLFKIPINLIILGLKAFKLMLDFTHVGYYSVGFGQSDAAPVRDKLEAKDYPVVDTQYVMHGGGSYNHLNKHLIIGGEGSGGGEAMTSGKYTVVGGAGEGRGFVGWMLRPLPFLRVYPLFGIGGGGSGLSVFQPQPDSPYVPPTDTSQVVTAENVDPLTVLIGVGVELRLGWLLFGVRAGYLQSPFASSGTAEKRPYLRVLFGAGRYTSS